MTYEREEWKIVEWRRAAINISSTISDEKFSRHMAAVVRFQAGKNWMVGGFRPKWMPVSIFKAILRLRLTMDLAWIILFKDGKL